MSDCLVEFLESWYAGHCGPDWDSSCGLVLETMDNPGWSLSVGSRRKCDELVWPAWERSPLRRCSRSKDDWIEVLEEEDLFAAMGGALNLVEIMENFSRWVRRRGNVQEAVAPGRPAIFHALQNWYLSQCDGDWEHAYGIVIATPGMYSSETSMVRYSIRGLQKILPLRPTCSWLVQVSLTGTRLARRDFEERSVVARPQDSWHAKKATIGIVPHVAFIATGGTRALERILQTFLNWAGAV